MVLICASVTVPAGETMFCTFSKVPRRVYPRAYGGTPIEPVFEQGHDGLSPRTGEPELGAVIQEIHRVYPRAYGGTVRFHADE